MQTESPLFLRCRLRIKSKNAVVAKAATAFFMELSDLNVKFKLIGFALVHDIRLVEAGASLIGGCCGTTPEYIAALAALKR